MKILKKISVSILVFIMVLSFELPSYIFNGVNAVSEVELKLTPQPYIDVVLAKAKTATQLDNFKPNLTTALQVQGVDINKVNITAIEAQQVNIQKAFQWNEDKDSSIGNISIINDGRDVTMIGNYSNPGKNAIWIIPDADLVQTFTFGYSIEFGDSFNAAGMLLRVQDNGNNLTGYMLSFNNTWTSEAGGKNGAIWKFTYYKKQNSSNIQKSLVQSLDIARSGTLTVKVNKQEIEVTEAGKNPVTVDISSESRGTGFGFFSDHYSHGCYEYGQFKLTNINLETENSKTFEEVLREPDWREDAIKILVNVEDIVNKQLSEPTKLGELLARMINDEIYYVDWGNDETKSQAESFIKSNNNKGKFINNTNYDNSITQTAAYIKSLIPTNDGSNYVLLTDNTVLSTADPSIMTNTSDGTFPNGKWKILHDCEYFENNIGQFAESGNYLDDMITSFNKTGKFEILYEDRNVEPKEIYVHRKPVAEFEVTKAGTSITLNNLSYDLDKFSQERGISEEKWEYRTVGEQTWKTGKLTTTNGGTDFLVQLTVKDFQNTWSAPVNKYITTNNQVPPIASFKIKNRNTSIYEKLEIIDGSYDPYGDQITSREWTLYDSTGKVKAKGNSPVLDYSSYGVGNYTLGLKVTNNRNMQSEEFKRTFTIIPDDEAPEFVATPTQCEWTKSIDVNLTFTDRLGSGFATYQYAITDSQTPATEWSSNVPKQTDQITINTDGIKYLHIKAKDNANNESKERVLGPYRIDKTPPVGTVSHNPAWVNDYTVLNWSFTDEQCGYSRTQLPDKQTTR